MRIDRNQPFVILMAEDDADDRLLTSEALADIRNFNALEFVEDGFELLEYLHSEGDYADSPRALPNLILLDLNMPRMSGLEALARIKQDARLRLIPVVVLSTSNSEADVANSYALGAASYLTKPTSYRGMVKLMKVLSRYWFEYVELPVEPHPC